MQSTAEDDGNFVRNKNVYMMMALGEKLWDLPKLLQFILNMNVCKFLGIQLLRHFTQNLKYQPHGGIKEKSRYY